MTKSPQSLVAREKSAFLSLNHASNTKSILLALLFLFLPTQLGKHFWPDFSFVSGIRVDYLSPTVYFTDVLIGLLFIVWLFNNRHSGPDLFRSQSGFYRVLHRISLDSRLRGNDDRRKLLINKNAILLLFIPVVLLANVFLADRVGLSSYYLLKLLEFSFLSFYIAQTIRTQTRLFVMTLLLAIGAFFESLLAILQYLQQGSLNGWLYYLGERMFTGSTLGIANASIDGSLILRPYGTFSHPNVLAGYLLIVSVIVFYFLVLGAKGFIRVFGIGVLIMASIALFLSLSRIAIGLWIVIVMLGVLWMVFQSTKRFKKRIVFAIAGSILVLLPFSHLVLNRFGQTSFLEESLIQRSELITSSLVMITTSPLFGVGLGNFIPALSPLQSPLSLGLYLQPVHNIYLLIAAETGLIGLGIFLIFIIATYYRITNYELRIKGLLLILLSIILIIGLFDHYFLTLQQGQLLFALVLGLCWTKSGKS